MATADPAALDQFISAFTGQVGSGFGAIAGPVQGVLATLVVISITISAILWAIDETQNIMAALVRKILLIGFFAWLVTNWHSLTLTVINGFAKLGLQASGGGSIGDFTRAPTKAVEAGLSVVIDLIKYIGDLAQQNAGFGALMHIDMIIVAAVAAIGILLAFIILAIEIAVTIIEFYIVTLIAFVVVPFGVLSQTSFLAEKAIGYVVSVGFKFMALAVIAGVGINIFETYTLSPQPTVAEEAGLLLSAIFLMMLSLKVPAIAGAMISGGPQLNTGGALMGAAGVAAGAAGVGLAARAAGGAVASGWAAGGEKIAAARAASGSINSGGPRPTGGGSSGSGMAADFARAPVSTTVAEGRAAGSRLFSSRNPSEGETPPPPPPEAPSSGSSVVSRAEARRGGGLAGAARDNAAAATAGGDGSGPGLSATPTRRDDEPEE
ncbi:MAG: P-type conjugative transfer protein TrbL [Phenylobacterium sp.]|jgi:type IV secretion system protein TrbL|uniref:P-type conjugative transfer protein TrbL n=1 Tax=Phenylobacterium sp. TaxID=1871053 RepID=UPI00273062B9|nr:P-type conjugative transfer protein TrbL [Phenylobacterium sp.]MDP1616303.1 P-type conjugative transfer protein TrbL [Phenylobacterium sp.]MDZ4375533.1 P-type conjugative transfer protein TrbL [Phenylobacterium sp.]